MTSRADMYRARARQAKEAAARESIPTIRDGYLKVAREWHELADEVELAEKR